MPQGVATGGNFLAPGRARAAGDPTPQSASLLTEDPIRFPVAQALYVRKTGSDNNGGSSVSTSATATGSDGVTDGTRTFMAASGVFDATYVDKLINIVGVGRFRIEEVVGATTLRLSAPTGAAVAGSGKTWNVGGAVLTVGALLGNGNDAVREGDTIYVGAGTYREVITIWVSPRNGANQGLSVVSLIGDVDGVQTGDAGMVRITSYTTNDKTAAADSPTIRFGAGVSFLSFSKLLIDGGQSSSSQVGQSGLVSAAGPTQGGNIQGVATSQYVAFTDCTLLATPRPLQQSSYLVQIGNSYPYPLNWTFDRCIFSLTGGFQSAVRLELATAPGGGADYSLALKFRNCSFSPPAIGVFSISTIGTTGGKPGGITLSNLLCGPVTLSGTGLSGLIPSSITNSIIFGSLAGNAAGSLTEDYNVIIQGSSAPRSNVAVGAHSISDGSYAPLIHYGQEQMWGGLLRMFGEPMAGSPLLGFGNDGTQTAYDLRNNPRPAGGGNALPAVGALERGNTFAKETGTVHTGSNAISATGPAYQDFLLAVASGTTYTLSIYVNYDGSYTGIAPQLSVLNGGEAGVSDQTVTAGGSAGGGWTQIVLASFNPTSNGFVTVRVQANDTSGVSETVFDSFAIS
jgi:hypothetical protein